MDKFRGIMDSGKLFELYPYQGNLSTQRRNPLCESGCKIGLARMLGAIGNGIGPACARTLMTRRIDVVVCVCVCVSSVGP